MLMLSRWPENAIEPREALTPRAIAIKEDESHPLRVLYVKAPDNWNAEPSESERCAQQARRNLASLSMLHGTAKRKNWARRVFLEWVAVTVGAEERRARKIKTCVERRREFFTPGALNKGCRLHLDRREDEQRPIIHWADPNWDTTPRRDVAFAYGRPLSSQAARLGADGRSHDPATAHPRFPRSQSFNSRSGFNPAYRVQRHPPAVPPRVAHMLHMMHTPFDA